MPFLMILTNITYDVTWHRQAKAVDLIECSTAFDIEIKITRKSGSEIAGRHCSYGLLFKEAIIVIKRIRSIFRCKTNVPIAN